MKTIYVGVPGMYANEGDAVLVSLNEVPGTKTRHISLPHLAIDDLAYQTTNPPDDLIEFWLREQRRFDRNYWVSAFLRFVGISKRVTETPIMVILLVGCDDEKVLCEMMDFIYRGSIDDIVGRVRQRVSALGGGNGAEVT